MRGHCTTLNSGRCRSHSSAHDNIMPFEGNKALMSSMASRLGSWRIAWRTAWSVNAAGWRHREPALCDRSTTKIETAPLQVQAPMKIEVSPKLLTRGTSMQCAAMQQISPFPQTRNTTGHGSPQMAAGGGRGAEKQTEKTTGKGRQHRKQRHATDNKHAK